MTCILNPHPFLLWFCFYSLHTQRITKAPCSKKTIALALNMKRSHFSFMGEENPHNIINLTDQQIPTLSGKRNKYGDSSNFLGRQNVQKVHVVDPQMDYSGRERLKRFQEEVAGHVAIPDTWGQEELLKDWVDYSPLDALLVPKGLSSAREALAMAGRTQANASQGALRIESRF